MNVLFFNCWRISFSLRFLSPRSPVLSRTLFGAPDEDDGACGGAESTLISDWREESRDELLVPQLRDLAALFTFLNILQNNRDKQKLVEICEKNMLVVSCPRSQSSRG